MATGAALTVAEHVAIGQINFRTVDSMTLGGNLAVLQAAFVVKTMPLEVLRGLVFIVVACAAAVMAR